MAQGDIIRKVSTAGLIRTTPVKPSGNVGQALVAALANSKGKE